ncbi:MAG TPA: response regulator [Ramlibacter sp.]|nr:response regulator [Ramlibacter sp.]
MSWHKQTNKEHSVPSSPSKEVLIIEDEEILAENLQAHFRRSGWNARIASTGKSAMAAAAEFRPALILLDYHLPDMSGFQALEALREADHRCGCVLMTGHPTDVVMAEAERHAIGRILCKPFSMAELRDQLLATAAETCSKCQRPNLHCGWGNSPQLMGLM